MKKFDVEIEKIKKDILSGLEFKNIVKSFVRTNNLNIELKKRTTFLDNIFSNIRNIDRLWLYINNIINYSQFPICEYCKKNKVRMEVNFKKDIGFSKTCSKDCGIKLGLLNAKSPEAIKKAEKTKKKVLMDKYGVDHVSKISEVKIKKHNTALKNYGSLKAAYYDTAKKTINDKYNVDHVSLIPGINEKKQKTSIKRYGTKYPWQSVKGKEKQKNGVLVKYNVTNISKLDEIKEKKKETYIKHYGVDNYTKTIEFIESISGKNNPNWKGGISKNEYCEIFTLQEFKTLIMERDFYKCLNPSCNGKCKNDLVIHHIDYNKMNCNLFNLITICRSCNTIANYDREWHKSWYSAIMLKRYNKWGLND